jgi:hypothetical protein
MGIKTSLPALLLLATLGCAPQPHGAAASQPTAGAESSTRAGAEPQMICKKERPTGSAISRRVCRPREEVAAQQQLDQMQRRANNAPGSATP